MKRYLRRRELFAGLILVLLVRKGDASDPSSLTVATPVVSAVVSKLPNQHDDVVGLLDDGGGHSRVVLKSWLSLPTGHHGKTHGLSHIKASLLSVGLVATLIRNLFFVEVPTTRNDWVAFGFLLVLYLVESATCSTRRYLSNIQTPSEVRDYIRRMQKFPPRITFHLECFHYEDDDNSLRCDASSQHRHDGNRSSNKRVTYRASELFQFQKWRDATKLAEVEESLDYNSERKATYVKITLTKLVLFLSAATYQDYQAQQARFVTREGNRDRYTDCWTSIEVDGYVRKMLAVRTVLGTEAHVRLAIFWIFTLLGLTVPYRIWFSTNCDALVLAISKEVS